MCNDAHDSRAYCFFCLGWALAYEGMDRAYANSLIPIAEEPLPCRRCGHDALWCEAEAAEYRALEAA